MEMLFLLLSLMFGTFTFNPEPVSTQAPVNSQAAQRECQCIGTEREPVLTQPQVRQYRAVRPLRGGMNTL